MKMLKLFRRKENDQDEQEWQKVAYKTLYYQVQRLEERIKTLEESRDDDHQTREIPEQKTLSKKEKWVYDILKQEGKTETEVTQDTGLKASSVKVYISRIRKKGYRV